MEDYTVLSENQPVTVGDLKTLLAEFHADTPVTDAVGERLLVRVLVNRVTGDKELEFN